jgi:hypothetical protein
MLLIRFWFVIEIKPEMILKFLDNNSDVDVDLVKTFHTELHSRINC